MPGMNEKQGIPMTEFIARNVEAGNYKEYDVDGERNKKTLMTEDEFAEKLRGYTMEDFSEGDNPYWDLLLYSRLYPGLYEQFSEVLIDVAKSLMTTQQLTFLPQGIRARIDAFKEDYFDEMTETTDILDYINKVEKDPETIDKVSVLPLMCGSGKSTAVTKKIIEVIKRNDGHGMLLVTDSIKRLGEIWNPNTENKLLSEEEKGFIKDHEKDVAVLTGDTYTEMIGKQKYSPVLCMTTQRFFHVLTKSEIKDFLRWKNGEEEGTRPLIIFDEEPFLNEVYDLTPKTVNDIDTMLRMVLDDDPKTQEDKKWCIDQWNEFRQKFLDQIWEYEHYDDGRMIYHEETGHCLTEDDERFFDILMKNRSNIRTDSTEVFKSLFAVKTFADTWGVYSHRTGNEYESKFTVYVDNSDKVKGLDAKVIVLDGTGDISPMYTGLDYIDMRDGMSFVRSLSHLTVRLGNIKTTKSELGEGRSFVPKAIISYLNSVGYNRDNAVIFTYKQHEAKFWPAFKNRTEHFGNIKGKNDYLDECCIAQVGLNQMQPVHYFTYMLARNEEVRNGFSGLTVEENCQQIKTILRDTKDCEEVMISHVLADIDQNMFRSAIRNAKNRQDVVYYVFYSDSQVPGLRKAINDRYCMTFSAHMESVNEETITEIVRAADTSAAQRLFMWYQEWNGEPIKREDICRQIGINTDTFKKTIQRNDELKELFGNAKVKASRNGYKRGWYMK